MKTTNVSKGLVQLLLGIIPLFSWGQNIFPVNGNVGIGTLTPITPLQVKGESSFDGSTKVFITNNASIYGRTNLVLTGRLDNQNDLWRFGTAARNSFVFSQNQGGAQGDYGDEKYSLQLEGNSNNLGFLSKGKGNTPVMVMTQQGNVGIGTTSPTERLTVEGALACLGSEGRSAAMYMPSSYLIGDIVAGSLYKWYNDIWTLGNIRSSGTPTNGFGISLNGNMVFKINPNGNIGFGTTTPQEKLSVNGNIRAREIKVEATNWPDYVFEEDYKITSLQDLEKYIKVNKHLPDMPSAKEVEINGFELGEMNKVLLKKVEELTLHLIEKDKELNTQKGHIQMLQSALEKQNLILLKIQKDIKLIK
ncbi:hypothetical protein [Pedobacter sp. MW01-1-1]|uniref:hypothetical protein n=1 Tax=Pedobacter sp. MW01-1-1 TaxID=3383027 RepID=UPI003FF0E9AF